MDSSPDFNSYTLEELLDVKKVVDPVKYPERAEAINTAISQKIATPDEHALMVELVEFDRYSTFWPRVKAAFIDGVTVFALYYALIAWSDKFGANEIIGSVFGVINHFDIALYSIAMHTLFGQTIGKMMMNIKLVDFITEEKITFKQALVRESVPTLAAISLFLVSILSNLYPESQLYPWLMTVLYSFLIISFFGWHLLEIISMLFNSKQRALHDIIAGTVVIRTHQ